MTAQPPDARVSDAERERIVERVREACIEGRLTLEELSERIGEAYSARTAAELERVTRELPAPAEPRPRRRSKLVTGVLFGRVERKGRWRPARRGLVVIAFGDADVDLRHAETSAPVVALTAVVLFGNVDFYVPEGVDVDLGGLTFFGHRGEWGRDLPPRPEAPLVRIRIFSLFGTGDVWRVPHGVAGSYRDLVRAVRAGEKEVEQK